jgi:type IV pilus assembly protein PilM
MAKAQAAWGIEVGNAAVKAVRLEREGSGVRVADFVVIPHPKVLTTPDLNIEEMLRISLGAFMQQKSLEGAAVVVSVPGYDGLARFAKLPPIPKKAVPQTVLFEANQQIPFPLDEVEWDYHLFASDDSPEYEVGIFAILKEKVAQRLGLYKDLGLRPNAMALGPLAVYNAMMADRGLAAPGQPVMAFLDIGTRATDLVVITDGRCWIRTFPIGGHTFTEAIVSAFKMPYGKAERYKAEAATHKHAKQLMHAMRPVFDDLLQEVQRSLGHHASLNPGKPISQVIGLGSTFRIPGLRKFLSDQLRIEVRRLEDFQTLKVEGSAAADFAGSAINLSTAVGLALQGLGQSAITINLSPVGNLREQVWRRKAKWFVAAALLVCAGSAALFFRPGGSVEPQVRAAVTMAKRDADEAKKKFEEAKQAADLGARANNVVFMVEDREVWPWIVADANAAVASAKAQAELLGDFDPASPPVPYEDWNTIELADLRGRYKFVPGATPKRTFDVTMRIVVPRDEKGAKAFVQATVLDWLNKNADRKEAPYVILIPEKGIVPVFGSESGEPGSSGGRRPGEDAVGGFGGDTSESPEPSQETPGGAGAVAGRNAVAAGSFQLGTGASGIVGSGGGGTAAPDFDDPGSGGGAGGSSSRKERKVNRVAVKSSSSDPVDVAADAAIPARPNPYAGQPSTGVTIRFTVELRPPEGRELSGGSGAAAPEEPSEETPVEGEQQ